MRQRTSGYGLSRGTTVILSRHIDEALRSVDLKTVTVEEIRAARDVPGVTAVVSRDTNAALRTVARERGCSITALANGAVEIWLESKKSFMKSGCDRL